MGRNNYTGRLHQYADAGPTQRGNWNQLLNYLEAHSISDPDNKNHQKGYETPLPPFTSPSTELKRELYDLQGLKNEDTPLRIAIRTAPASIIAALCHLGPDATKIQDSRRRLPIHWACRRPPKIITANRSNSNNIKSSMSDNNSSSSIKNIERIFQILILTYPESLLHKDDCGRTPLHWLLWYHAPTRTTKLVDMFCLSFKYEEDLFNSIFKQTNEKDLLADTFPLPTIPYPSSQDNVPASALIIHDAKHGALPLHYAVMEGASSKVIKLLVNLYPASKTLVDRRGRTPLAWYLGAGEFYCSTSKASNGLVDDSYESYDSNNESSMDDSLHYNTNHQIQHISGELPDPNATPRYEEQLSTNIVQHLLNSKVSRTCDYDTGRLPLHWACHLLARHYYNRSTNSSSNNNSENDDCRNSSNPCLSTKAIKLLLDNHIEALIVKDFVGRTPLHVLFDCVQDYQKLEWVRLSQNKSVRDDLDLIRGGIRRGSGGCNFHPPIQLIELLIESPFVMKGGINNENDNIPRSSSNVSKASALESPRTSSNIVPQYKPLQQQINDNNNNATHVEDKYGQLPIHIALRVSTSSEIIQVLIQSNPTSLVHTTEVECQTPLHSSLSNKYTTPIQSLNTIMLLLQAYVTSKHGTYVNGRIALKMEDTYGNYPLHYACKNSACLEVIRLLLEKYPKSCTCTNENGDLPLHLLMDTYLFGSCSNINDIIPQKMTNKNDIDNYIKHNVHNFTYDNVVELDEDVGGDACITTTANTTNNNTLTVGATLMIKNENQSWESPAETKFRIYQFRIVQQKMLLLIEPFIHDLNTLKQTNSVHNMNPLHMAIAFNAVPYNTLYKLICTYPQATTYMSAPPLLLLSSINNSNNSVVRGGGGSVTTAQTGITTTTNKKVLLKMSPLDFHDIRKRNAIVSSSSSNNNDKEDSNDSIDLNNEQWEVIQELLFCFGPQLDNHRLRNDLLQRCCAIVRDEAEGRGSIHSSNIQEMKEEDDNENHHRHNNGEDNNDNNALNGHPSFDIHADSFPSFDKTVLHSIAGPTNYRPKRDNVTPAKEKLKKAQHNKKQQSKKKQRVARAIRKKFSTDSIKDGNNKKDEKQKKQNKSIYDADDITGHGYVASPSESYDDFDDDFDNDYFDDESMMDDVRSEEEEYYSDEYDSRYDDAQFDDDGDGDNRGGSRDSYDDNNDSFDEHSEMTDDDDASTSKRLKSRSSIDDGIEQVLTMSSTEEEKKETENEQNGSSPSSSNREFSLSDVAMRLWIFFNLYNNPNNIQDHYAKQVECILDEMDFSIVEKLVNLQLPEYASEYLTTHSDYKDISINPAGLTGLTVRDVANANCKAVIYRAYHFVGMYDFQPTSNNSILLHRSTDDSTLVVLANQHDVSTEEGRGKVDTTAEEDIWTTGNVPKPKAKFSVTKQRVCVKFMKDKEAYYREVQSRSFMRVPVEENQDISAGAVVPLKNHFCMGNLEDSTARKIDRRYQLDVNDERFKTLFFDSNESTEFGHSINLLDYPYCIVFPISEEGDLYDYFMHRGMVDVNEIRQVALQVGRSLQAMHEKSIVHTNVSMRNIVCLPSSSDDDANTRRQWVVTNLSCSCQKAATQNCFVGGISSNGSTQFTAGSFPPEMFVRLSPIELKQYNEYWDNVHKHNNITIDKELIDSHLDNETGDSYVLRCYYTAEGDKSTTVQSLPYKLLPARETLDLWSFGLIMFTLCSGGHPLFLCNSRTGNLLSYNQIAKWDRETAKRMVYKHIDDPFAQDLLLHLLGPYEERAALKMEAILSHPFFTKPVNMEKALNRMLELRAHDSAALVRAQESSSSKCATERWLDARTRAIDCWDLDFQLRMRLSPSELIQKVFCGDGISSNSNNAPPIIPYSFIVLPYRLGINKAGKFTPVTKKDVERAERTGKELLNLSKACDFARSVKHTVTDTRGEKTSKWSVTDLIASLDLSTDDFKDLESDMIAMASQEVEMFRDNPMYVANKLVQKAITKLIERFEESKKAYVYLVDEYMGVPIVGDYEGVTYPHEVTGKIPQMVARSLPFMHMCILYLRGVSRGIGGLVKLIFEGAYPHIPPSWAAVSKGLSHELNELSIVNETQVLHDALTDSYSNKTKVGTRSVEDLRYVERYFQQFDKKQNFAGLLRVTNGRASIWTREKGMKEIEDQTSSKTFTDAYEKQKSDEVKMQQQEKKIAELQERLEKLEFRNKLGLKVPE